MGPIGLGLYYARQQKQSQLQYDNLNDLPDRKSLDGYFPLFGSGSGPSSGLMSNAWTASRIKQVRHLKHWISIAVTRICDKQAQLSPIVSVSRSIASDQSYDHTLSDTKRHYNRNWTQWARRRGLTQIQNHEELEPAPSDHRLVRLLQDPNPFDTAFDLWYETNLFLELTGSCYWWCVPDAVTGLPHELWVVPSHWMWPVFGRNGALESYDMRPIEGNAVHHTFPAEDIIHFKQKSPTSKVDGFSQLSAGAEWVDTSESVDRATRNSYKNGPLPSLQIELDPAIHDPDEAYLARLHARIASRYAGEENAHRPLVLPPGFKAKALNIMPSELMLEGNGNRMRDNILALFGVPKVTAGLGDKLTYGAILAAHAGFCSNKINPRNTYLGQMITEKLAWRFDSKLKVWWQDSTPEDSAALERRLSTDIKAQIIRKDEMRAIRGMTPLGPECGGNDFCGDNRDQGDQDGRGPNKNPKPDYPDEHYEEGLTLQQTRVFVSSLAHALKQFLDASSVLQPGPQPQLPVDSKSDNTLTATPITVERLTSIEERDEDGNPKTVRTIETTTHGQQPLQQQPLQQ